jgi:uncharacterized protein (TIRG00374 family)
MRNHLPILIKLSLLALAVALVLHFRIVTLDKVIATFVPPRAALVALGLILIGAQLSVLRWHLLLRWQGSPLPYRRVWQISYISWFLGSILPGAAGGDALRAGCILRAAAGFRVPAVLTILLDRLFGLVALLIVALAVAAVLARQIASQPVLAGLIAMAAAALLGLTTVLPFAAWLKRRLVPMLARRGHPRLARPLRIFDEAAAQSSSWRLRPMRLFLCLGLGIAGHALVVAAIVVLAMQLGQSQLSVAQICLAATLAILANHLPLTPGGLGVGEASFAQICLLLAPGSGAVGFGSVIVAFRLVTLLSYLPGGVALLTYREAVANARSIAESTAVTPASSSAG